MYKGKWSYIKNAGVFLLAGIHSFILVTFFYKIWIQPLSIIILLTGGGLIIFALITFIANGAYYYYFFIGIIFSSIPFIFLLPYNSYIIIPEVIIILSLMYRNLTRGEAYIKTNEVGLTNIPRDITSIKINRNVSNQMRSSPKKNQLNVKMFFIALTLTMLYLISVLILI